MPKNFDPFKLSSAVRPLCWARRHRRASTELLVSTVCTMTSSGQAAHSISQTLAAEGVCLAVRERVQAAGINPNDYSGHSLRAGLATSAARAGVAAMPDATSSLQ